MERAGRHDNDDDDNDDDKNYDDEDVNDDDDDRDNDDHYDHDGDDYTNAIIIFSTCLCQTLQISTNQIQPELSFACQRIHLCMQLATATWQQAL